MELKPGPLHKIGNRSVTKPPPQAFRKVFIVRRAPPAPRLASNLPLPQLHLHRRAAGLRPAPLPRAGGRSTATSWRIHHLPTETRRISRGPHRSSRDPLRDVTPQLREESSSQRDQSWEKQAGALTLALSSLQAEVECEPALSS